MIIQEAVLKLFDNFLGLLFLFELDEPIAHGLPGFVSDYCGRLRIYYL